MLLSPKRWKPKNKRDQGCSMNPRSKAWKVIDARCKAKETGDCCAKATAVHDETAVLSLFIPLRLQVHWLMPLTARAGLPLSVC